jgi:hypothetical protein
MSQPYVTSHSYLAYLCSFVLAFWRAARMALLFELNNNHSWVVYYINMDLICICSCCLLFLTLVDCLRVSYEVGILF